MAFTKLQWLAYTDQALGFQTVNLAQANQLEHADVLTLRHGQTETSLAFGVSLAVATPKRFGNHNDVRIPRGMQYLSTVSVVGAAVAGVGATFGKPQLGASSQSVVTRIDRLGVGLYFAALTGLAIYEAHAVPTTPAAANVRRVLQIPANPNQNAEPGIFFQCQELDGSNVFQLTDFDFSFAVYGTV